MKTNTPPRLKTARRTWLRSASMMAAATALVAAHAATAQVRPGAPSIASNHDRSPVRIHDLRARQPGRTINASGVSTPTVPTRDLAITSRGNPVAALVQQVVSINPAPMVPTIRVPAATQSRSFASAGTVTVPRAAATVDGISVNASASFDDTQVAYTPSVSGDVVELLGTSAIIDWTTFDAGAPFTEVTFVGFRESLSFTGDASDYTVLNRITTPGFDSAIRIDGEISSTTNSGATTGGNIWFYSAGGIVIGQLGTFNVGSLLLSTSEIDPADVQVGAFDVNFLGTPNPESRITVASGNQINALNPGSYVAMVAPRIELDGQINVNGSAAFVAAEQATLSIQNGLFDISVGLGTEDSFGIIHGQEAETGGPSSTGVGDGHGIYFVAVPKNDALTMLMSGTVGYEAASSADIVNGRVVLTNSSRVERVDGFEFNGNDTVPASSNIVDISELGLTNGGIDLGSLSLTSSTRAVATDNLDVFAVTESDGEFNVTAGSALSNPVDLELIGGNSVSLEIDNGGEISATGDLLVTAGDGRGNGGQVTVELNSFVDTGTGGGGPVRVSGGPARLVVDGDLVIDAAGRGLDDAEGVLNNGGQGIGGDGVGGDITVNITESSGLVTGGDLILDASANGGRGSVREGAATGGSASLTLSEGSLSVGGDLILDAQADRAGTLVSSSLGIAGNVGSSSTGGSVSLVLEGGSADLQRVVLNASGRASSGLNDGIAQSNEGNAGTADISVSGGFHTVDSINIDVTARAAGRIDNNGVVFVGDSTRGSVSLSVFGSDTSLVVNNDVFVDARVIAGVTPAPVEETVSVTVTDTGMGTGSGLTIGRDLDINAGVSGGQIGSTHVGGSVSVEADNGNLFTDGIFISSAAGNSPFSARSATEATDFQGGDISIIATNGGGISSTGFSSISSTGQGQAEESASDVGIGQGGTVTLLANDGTINFTDRLRISASGFALGGVSSTGETGQGRGGTVRVTVQGDNGVINLEDFSAGTDGTFSDGGDGGVEPFVGDGSLGVGGLTEFNVLGGTLTAVEIEVSSDGSGGSPGGLPSGPADPDTGLTPSGDGGAGIGGQVVFNLDGGDATVGDLDVTANARGGSGETFFFSAVPGGGAASAGGDATGGSATFNAISGSLTVTGTLSVEATGNEQFGSFVSGGRGGRGNGVPGADGGNAQGGTATFNLDGTATIDANAVVVSTQAFGGEGGASDDDFNGNPDMGGGRGGNAIGGTAIFTDTAGDITFGSLTVNSSGVGGIGGGSFGQTSIDAVDNGGMGGDGVGGLAQITLNQDDADPKSYSVISQGLGGEGGIGARGGDGGLGQGGTADLVVNADVIFDSLSIDASATGGLAGFSEGAVINNGADGGDAIGGTAQLRVTGPTASFAANSTIGLLASATGAQAGDGAFAQFGIPGPAGDGGTGGTATGGSAFVVAEDGASISINPFLFTFGANAIGGAGGNGGGNSFDDDAGNGGAGGDATGGSLGFVANTGAELVIDPTADVFTLSAEGIGGAGGSGGDASAITAQSGVGGDGGAGTGGTPLISATGASILAGDIEFIADGTGGDGGLGGQNATTFAASGLGGDGVGGTPTIEAIQGSPGIVTLGNVSIAAAGTGGTGSVIGLGSGGQITISDTSTDPLGLITIGDLTIDALGDVGTSTGLITITSDSGPITVTNGLDIDVTGAINIAMENDGQLLVNPGDSVFSATTFDASGDITVSHVNPAAGVRAIDAGNTFTAVSSGGTFNSSAQGEIVASSRVTITAADIAYETITSPSVVSLTATTGSITGTSDGTITASGVIDAILLDAAQDVTFGTLISENDGFVTVQAGGDITGGAVDAIEAVDLDAGGTIAVDLIDATRAIDGVGQVLVDGGAIDLGTVNAQGLVNLTSTVGDVAIEGFNGPSSGTINSAAAIDIGTAVLGGFQGNAATGFTANSVTTTGGFGDLNIQAGGTAAFTTLNSNRGTQIRASDIVGGDIVSVASVDLAVPGSISIGDLATTASANVVITTDAGDISTGQIDVVQGIATINSGGSGDISGIDASASTNVTTVGDLSIGDVTAGSSGALSVGGDLIAGDLFAATTSPGLSLDVAGNAEVDSADTNGLLNVDIAGALTGGDFSGAQVDIDADSIDIASAVATDFFLNIDAPGAVSVGNASAVFTSAINGASVNIDNGTFERSLTVTSDSGDITGLGSITVANTATFTSAANIAIGSLEATTIALTANGGDLQFNDLVSPNTISVQATGLIGATTPGQGNINSGGAVDIDASAIDLGNVISDTSITANASVGDASFGDLNAGSFINIVAIGSPSARSVTSVGDTSLTGASVTLNGGDVGGSLQVTTTVGDITLAFDGAQQLLVGGAAFFNSAGGMIVTHTNNTDDTLSVDVGGGIFVDVGGSFNSGAGSILNAIGEVSLFANGDISANDLRTGPGIILTAGGNVTLNNATATGPQGSSNFRGIVIDAGLNNVTGLPAYDTLFDATITGEVTSYADITINAGGSAVFDAGSNTNADNAVFVTTGDDIIVRQGASVASANNPTDPIDPTLPFDGGPNLVFEAGSLANLLTTPQSPIASIVLDGTLNANEASIILDANAIEGLDSSLFAGSIKADVRDAPANGATFSDDSGLLIAPCLEGSVCLGNMQAENIIEIGLDSNSDVISLFIEQAEVTATDISIQTRNDIVMGTNGINTTLDATGTFFATSVTGDVNLQDTEISANQILIDAAGSLLGSGILTSANDIGIDVGDSIIAGGIITDGQLSIIANVGVPFGTGVGAPPIVIVGDPRDVPYIVPGDFIVGQFSEGAPEVRLEVGGDINIGTVSNVGTIFADAGGDAFVGFANLAGSIGLSGQSLGYQDLTAGELIVMEGEAIIAGPNSSAVAGLDAEFIANGLIDVGLVSAERLLSLQTFGDISFTSLIAAPEFAQLDVFSDGLGSITGGDIVSGGTVDVFSFDDFNQMGGDISLGDVSANDTVTVTGGSIALGNVVANDISLLSLGDILFNGLNSANSIALDASNGLVANNGGDGDIESDGEVTIDALGIAIGDVTSQGSVVANATDGDASFGAVNAVNDITITASGSPSVLNAISGGSTTITGSSVTLDNGTIGTDLTLVATTGDIDGDGAVTVGGAIDFSAPGNIGFGDLTAQGGSFEVDAGGAIVFTGATSTDFVNLTANGSVAGGDLNAANEVNVDAGDIAVGDVTADQISLTSATNILFDLVQSPNAITLTANGGAIGANTGPGDIISDDAVNLLGVSIDVGQIDAGGDVTAEATDGDLGTGAINANGAVTLDALSGAIATGDIEAASNINAEGASMNLGDLLARGAGNEGFDEGAINLDASGEIALMNATSEGAFTINSGGNVTAATLTRRGANEDSLGLSVDTSGDVSVDALTSATSVTVIGSGLEIGTVNASQDVTLDGDMINFTTLSAGVDAFVDAANGDVIAQSLSAGGTADIDAANGAIGLDALTANDPNFLANDAINVGQASVDGILTAQGASIDVTGLESLSVDVTATDGDISVSAEEGLNVFGATASGDVDLRSDLGDLTVSQASGANVDLTSRRSGVRVLGAADATDALMIDSNTGLRIEDGSVVGETIGILSPDIDIAVDGSVGDATRTQSITFDFRGDGRVGGDATDLGFWELDNSELARVHSAGEVNFNALSTLRVAQGQSSGGSDITIGALSVTAGNGSTATGQNIGQNGTLSFSATGDLVFDGEVSVSNATTNTLLLAEAEDLVRVNTASGGLFMLDGNGNLAGEISIRGTDFIAATDQAFVDIDGLSVAEIDVRLAENDGVDRPDGAIRADTLTIATTASQVFIQNTAPGTEFDDRRGFDVNTLTISSGGGTGSLQPIVINGIVNGNTGISAIAPTNVLSPADPASTINGCVIADPASCSTAAPPPPPPPTPTPPPSPPPPPPPGGSESSDNTEVQTRDLIEEGLQPPDVRPDAFLVDGLIDLDPDTAFEDDPLIDDPVTGAGNEDLWVDDEECEEGEECAL